METGVSLKGNYNFCTEKRQFPLRGTTVSQGRNYSFLEGEIKWKLKGVETFRE